MSDLTDTNTLYLLQGKTFRVNFTVNSNDATPVPISLSAYGASFSIYSRAGGSLIIQVTDQTVIDPDENGGTGPFPTGDAPVVMQPSGETGVVAVRLGAEITSTIAKTGAYDAWLYKIADPTEVQPLGSGPLIVLPYGADMTEASQFA